MMADIKLVRAYEWMGLAVQQMSPMLTAEERREIQAWSEKVFFRLKIGAGVQNGEWPLDPEEQWAALL